MNQILALWAHPRSLSTAVERIMIERGDFEVLHEPFSVVYYHTEGRAAAVHADFSETAPSDYESVRDDILRRAQFHPVCFKDMCYHCHDHLLQDDEFLRRMTSVFLIRDPRPTIASHFAKNSHMTNDEIGYEMQAGVFRKVARINGSPPPVISAEELQMNPGAVMSALWIKIGVGERPDALRWSAGHKTEWNTWEEWHREVADSTSIRPASADAGSKKYEHTVENHAGLAEFEQHHRPFYEEMYRHRICAPDQ